jgi:hypothetical protein
MSQVSLLYNAHCIRPFPRATHHCTHYNRNEQEEERKPTLTDIFDEAQEVIDGTENISCSGDTHSSDCRRKNTDDYKNNDMNSRFPPQ